MNTAKSIMYVVRLNGRSIKIFRDGDSAVKYAQSYPAKDGDLVFVSVETSETIWQKGDIRNA